MEPGRRAYPMASANPRTTPPRIAPGTADHDHDESLYRVYGPDPGIDSENGHEKAAGKTGERRAKGEAQRGYAIGVDAHEVGYLAILSQGAHRTPQLCILNKRRRPTMRTRARTMTSRRPAGRNASPILNTPLTTGGTSRCFSPKDEGLELAALDFIDYHRDPDLSGL